MTPSNLKVVALALAFALPSFAADESKPTRAAFIREVLDAKPTAVTPRFDDYTQGSYHVDREDLLKGLTEEAKKQKLELKAVAIIGPTGPLWTYHVMVFLREGEKVRVNSLVMPHARITGKGTGLITADQFEEWRKAAVASGVLQEKAPERPEILLATWDKDGKAGPVLRGEILVADEKKKESLEALSKAFEAVLKDVKDTYPEKEKK